MDISYPDIYETHLDTTGNYSSMNTDRINGIEVMSGSMLIEEAVKSNSNARVVPLLDYRKLRAYPEPTVAKTHDQEIFNTDNKVQR